MKGATTSGAKDQRCVGRRRGSMQPFYLAYQDATIATCGTLRIHGVPRHGGVESACCAAARTQRAGKWVRHVLLPAFGLEVAQRVDEPLDRGRFRLFSYTRLTGRGNDGGRLTLSSVRRDRCRRALAANDPG